MMRASGFFGWLAAIYLLFIWALMGRHSKAQDPTKELNCVKLNVIETKVLEEHYAMLLKRELSLEDSVRACIKTNDSRLGEYQEALSETKQDIKKTKARIAVVEKSSPPLVSPEIKKLLEMILERLDNLEKRNK